MGLRNILVATDMSQRSDRAIARACLLARQFGAVLHILHVVDDELPAPIAEAEITAAEASLGALVSSGHSFQGIEAKAEVVLGDPWRGIIQKADDLDADLVVMGSDRYRGFEDMFTGTTLERVTRISQRPVLRVVALAIEPYKVPVVGVDFSASARNAARLAPLLAPGKVVTLVHGYHVPYRALTMHVGTLGTLSKAEKDQIDAELAKQMAVFEAEVGQVACEFRVVITEGAPDHVLPAQVQGLGADLLCLGMHSRSWLSEALVGSTARKMLADCPCDLLLAPPLRSDD
jgi:nucleotide-binding universal stress UspA family protein